jgi:hypothetical protein
MGTTAVSSLSPQDFCAAADEVRRIRLIATMMTLPSDGCCNRLVKSIPQRRLDFSRMKATEYRRGDPLGLGVASAA